MPDGPKEPKRSPAVAEVIATARLSARVEQLLDILGVRNIPGLEELLLRAAQRK